MRATDLARLDLTSLLDGPTYQQIDAWRSSLANGLDAVTENVASSIARVIADSNLAFATAGNLTSLFGADLRQAVEEASSSYATGMGKFLRESSPMQSGPAAYLATSALVEVMRAPDECEREMHEALWRLGWWFPPRASATAFWHVGRLAEHNDRVAVRRAIAELASSAMTSKPQRRVSGDVPLKARPDSHR